MRKLDALIIIAVAITFVGMIGAAVAFTWLNAQDRPQTGLPTPTPAVEQAQSLGGAWCGGAPGDCAAHAGPAHLTLGQRPEPPPVSLGDGRTARARAFSRPSATASG